MARRSNRRSQPSWGAAVLIELLAVLGIGALALYRPPPESAEPPFSSANRWRPSVQAPPPPAKSVPLPPTVAPTEFETRRQVEQRLQRAGQALRQLTGQAVRAHWQSLTR